MHVFTINLKLSLRPRLPALAPFCGRILPNIQATMPHARPNCADLWVKSGRIGQFASKWPGTLPTDAKKMSICTPFGPRIQQGMPQNGANQVTNRSDNVEIWAILLALGPFSELWRQTWCKSATLSALCTTKWCRMVTFTASTGWNAPNVVKYRLGRANGVSSLRTSRPLRGWAPG